MFASAASLLIALAIHGADPASYRPTEGELSQIRAKTAELATAIDRLAARRADRDLLLDVEIYHKAATWIVRYADEEFYDKRYVRDTLFALDHGLARAKELEAGRALWPAQKGQQVRAYRSQIDDSVQPYAISIPACYDGRTAARLDVVLHGRAMKQNEVNFIARRDGVSPVPPELDHLQLDVFGRGNNAFRWAGETDVFEAIASVCKRYKVDPRRIVLRGFSMGGAGAWHLGLHYPDRWAAVEAGAGFSDTKGFLKLDTLPDYQEPTLRIYDAFEYALNAFDVPTVGYGGEKDHQLQSAVNVREQLVKEGVRFTPDGLNWRTKDLTAVFLVGPDTAHKFHPDSKRQSEAFIQANLAGRTAEPSHIRFITYTTRYHECFWLKIAAMDRHYQRAEVDAQRSANGISVKTRNVAELILASRVLRGTLTVDGKEVALPGGPRSLELRLEKQDSVWTARDASASAAGAPARLRKTHGLQGPIDDAFLESFLCVRPTGVARNKLAQQYALAALDGCTRDFARWMHGDVRVKLDTQVTAADMAAHHLVLFGDPGSNRVLGRIADRLPIRWTADAISLGKQTYPAADHSLLMIYPNPLQPNRYVVINTGHTFHEPEFRGNNALVYPRLGDFAVLRLDGGKQTLETAVETAGIFDDRWQLPR
jgi:dienelactone hydrolase